MTTKRTEVALGITLIADVRGADRDGRGASLPRRRRPAAGRRPKAQPKVHVIRRRSGEVPVQGCRLASALDREYDHSRGHVRSGRVQPELERRRDPEVRAGAAQSPEQLWVVLIAHVAHATVRRDEIDREQVVDRVAVLALETAHAASQRQTTDPGVSDNSYGARHAVLLSGAVQLLEKCAALDPRGACDWIDTDGLHPREVDDHAAVARRGARENSSGAFQAIQHRVFVSPRCFPSPRGGAYLISR